MRPYEEFLKEVLKMVEANDYASVSGFFMSHEQGRQLAFEHELWYFRRITQDSFYLWNGNGIDPRERK